MEQYSHRICLKFSGIPEERLKKTDDIIIRIANQFILSKEQLLQPTELHQISRSQRVGQSSGKKIPRHVSVRFVSYRDKARVLRNKNKFKYQPNTLKQI